MALGVERALCGEHSHLGLEWPQSLTLYFVTGTLFLGMALWLAQERMP